MNEMSKYIRQGLAYIINIYTSHYDSLASVRYYTEEMVFGIELLVQYYYLTKKSATYGENFFNFKRSVMDNTLSMIKPITKWHIVVTLLFETFLPYLKAKL